jgi:hypothetical protein
MGLSGATREGVNQGEVIRLLIQYQDQSGNFVDPSTFPTITIINPQNVTILIANETSGIGRIDTGLFFYDYTVSSTAIFGIWHDVWSVNVNGVPLNTTLDFIVNEPTSPIVAQAGQELDPKLSATATKNVLDLMKLLRARLGSDGTRRKRDKFEKYILDANGNFILEPCNVFSTEELYIFLKASLAEFNSIPHFTSFTFDDVQFVNTFNHELTEGAFILALAKQGLMEKGREFQMTDDGLSYQPPLIADYIKGYLSDFMTSYRERVKFIKCQMKPDPVGFSSYPGFGGGANPALRRLRFLRQRQII